MKVYRFQCLAVRARVRMWPQDQDIKGSGEHPSISVRQVEAESCSRLLRFPDQSAGPGLSIRAVPPLLGKINSPILGKISPEEKTHDYNHFCYCSYSSSLTGVCAWHISFVQCPQDSDSNSVIMFSGQGRNYLESKEEGGIFWRTLL